MKKNFTICAVIALFAGQTAASTRTTSDDVITSAEGKTLTYEKTFSGCMQYPEFAWTDNMTAQSKIVFGDNDDVYFLDLLSMMPMLSYVKGEKSGDKICVTLPQVVSYSDEWGFVLEIDVNLVKVTQKDGNTDMVAADGENTVTFTVGDDGSITLDTLDDGYGLALMQMPNNVWYGFMENKIKYVPTGDSSVETIGGNTREIDRVTFVDLSGRKVSDPQKGIFVKHTVYTDGSEESCKVIVR